MKLVQQIMLVALALLLSHSALAARGGGGGGGGFSIDLDIAYWDTKTTQCTGGSCTESPSNLTFTDLNVGYEMPTGLYLGVIALSDAIKVGSNSTNTISGYGAGVGYHSNGWLVEAMYIFSSKYSTGSSAEYVKGSGYSAKIGYQSMLGTNFFVGANLIIRSIKWTALQTGGVEDSSQTYSRADTMPAASLGVAF